MNEKLVRKRVQNGADHVSDSYAVSKCAIIDGSDQSNHIIMVLLEY